MRAPYKLIFGQAPNNSLIRVFDRSAYVQNQKARTMNKMDFRSDEVT